MDLVANNLSYKPDDQYHLNEVSFNFKEGNLYTILGRTLSGKTTLLNPYISRFYGKNCCPVLEYSSCSFTLCYILYFVTSEIYIHILRKCSS